MTNDPSPMPPAHQQRSRLTQTRIFTEGTRLLQEGGPEALTVAAVAKAAGVSVGSVYRRFGDKDRLLAAIQAGFTEDFRAEFRRRVTDTELSPATPPGEVIASAVAAVAESFHAHAPLMRVFMLMGTQNRAVFEEGSRASVAGGRFFRDTVLLAAPALRHHSDIEAAIDFAHRLTYATCAHRVIQGENLESARPLPWPDLIEELTRAVSAFLLCRADR
ncbi:MULTISPECIES: TetR family transcriptional regulator [Streptomyces]|uniref:TetR family transcriptional regulator n=1 Tax=Streptomyces phaeolivaceus TaxID=2653200 RepID=A0A5P8KG22_9ACTN|nr:TetR family transcriptional regulator [Streptomyces phaeolivaceus]QFR01709.1 TetR family transcriptional regulator [Streptomyces phaeolivaceus]